MPDVTREHMGHQRLNLMGEIRFPGLRRSIPAGEVVMFARSLSIMTRAGLPVLECFRVLTEQTDNQAFKGVIRDVARHVAEGVRLAVALEKHPWVFDTMFVKMVAAGEAGGVLPELLDRVAAFAEKSVRVRKKIKAAMVYPVMISAVAMVTIGVLLVYVIPVFAEVYGNLGKPLPAPTRLTIAASQWFRTHFLFIILTFLGSAFGGYVAYGQPRGRAVLDGWLLAIPILGEVKMKVGTVRFAYNMAALLGAGLTAIDSLPITAETLGNRPMEDAVLDARDRLAEGEPMARPLAASKVFPPVVCQLIAVGENTGALGRVLRTVAVFYEEELDRALAQLNALLEPVIMIVLGIVLGAIVISMYLPIFQMGELVQ